MTEINIPELAHKIITDVKSGALVLAGVGAVKDAIKKANGFVGKIVAAGQAIGELIYATVKYVETLAADLALAGPQKKELAVVIINSFLDIPWLRESDEAVIIGFALDVLITAFNMHLGHAWLKKGGV